MQRAFLSALYEGDGWIEQGPEVGLTTASRKMAEQVQLLLYGLGIPASLRTRHHDELDRDYHTVLVPPGAVHRFLDQVGFRSERRAAQVATHLRDSAPNTQLEHVPFMRELLFDLRDALGGDRELDALIGDLRRDDLTGRADGRIDCSPTRLLKVLDWIETRHVPASARPLVAQLHELAARPLTFERIVSVEAAGEVPTFDVVVPGTHSFLANGVLSHNTTVALHAIAEAQKLGGIAAFIDAEHALDPTYARALGVDINELLVSQPDTGEQALEIADMLIRSAAVDIIVIDSVAALTPRAEIEGEMGDTHVGLQARLMSQALRKIAGSLNRSKTTAVFINQLREKIGVMFGCASSSNSRDPGRRLPRDDRDHRQEQARRRGPVLRREGGSDRPSPGDELVRQRPHARSSCTFAVAHPGWGPGRHEAHIEFTPNHLIMTPDGWLEAQQLRVGDRVVQSVPHYLSGFQWEVLLGTLMGDGSLSPASSGLSARLRCGPREGAERVRRLEGVPLREPQRLAHHRREGRGLPRCQPLPELGGLRDAVYIGGRKVLSEDYLKALTPLSLALWYMDDASFACDPRVCRSGPQGGSGRVEVCVQAFDASTQKRLRDHLADTWGLESRLAVKGRREMAHLIFTVDASDRFQEIVAPFIHPSMDYKLLPRSPREVRCRARPRGTALRAAVPMPIESDRRTPGAACRRPTGTTSRSRARTTTSLTGSWSTTAPRRPLVGGR